MKVLVVGGGGRCHAIVDALRRSPKVEKIYCAPGNAGIAEMAENVPLKDTDVQGLLAFAQDKGVDLTVVGPEVALQAGIVDEFRLRGLRIFGPTAAAARIETSKEFAKELMMRHGIPTAAYRPFDDYRAAMEYVASRPLPAVLKYDGLAAGKGVVIARSMEEAEAALRDMLLDDRFGHGRVIVEDYLEGPEFSFMCFVSGSQVWPMPLAQDHKRAYDGDQGPNTGGMGAYSPVPFVSEEERRFALNEIMKKTAAALVLEGLPFTGVLYGGLMKTKEGIKVIEFNARFGDPETEVVLPRLKSDIYDIFAGVAEGRQLEEPVWDERAALGIVMASEGYPGACGKGFPIRGLDTIDDPDIRVYHMGTAASEGGVVTAGGRVLIVVGRGETLASARLKAVEGVGRVECDKLFYRKDIGAAALEF
jgi:phosphoribosylamine--glycine ligase